MTKKKLNAETVFTALTKITGFKLILPSGNEFIYNDVNDEGYVTHEHIEFDELNYSNLTICIGVIVTALEANDSDFDEAIKDLREIRKAYHNYIQLKDL